MLGYIYPDRANPILPYRNNENAWTDYIFYLSFSTRIEKNAEMEIVFPIEYEASQIVLAKNDRMVVNDACPVEIKFS